MHDIEPYYQWRDNYTAEEDERSPFYGCEYSEFSFSNRIYNYYIHPQWDAFGSSTLYMKLLYADYDESFAIIELIGEWNDCLHNDVMLLKRNVIDSLMGHGISRFAVICENVLNFHNSDLDYYQEWNEEVTEMGGWVAMINTLDHVESEMKEIRMHDYVRIGGPFNAIQWRGQKPVILIRQIDDLVFSTIPLLP